MSYMGIDVGTSGCKAVVFDDTGKQLGLAYREYATLTPQQGWAELNSAHVCDCCCDVIREATAAAGGDRVRGIGISSQGEAFTPVASDGEFLGNGMVSSDARATIMAQEWSKTFGRDRLYHITGHTAHPMFTLFKLMWVRDNQPGVWKHASHFLCYEDLLHFRLGLEPAISWPLAGRTMLFNVTTHEWDAEILEAVGLEASRLARPLPSGSVVGEIPSDIARGLGLGEDVIVVTGGHDQPVGALGAGVMSPNTSMYATGTVECMCPAFPSPIFSDSLFESNLCTYDYTIQGMYATIAFSLTGGNLLRWFRDEWAQVEVAEAARTGVSPYQVILQEMSEEPTNLLVLPYFTPSGTPYFDPHVPGAILGLRLTTTRKEVLRALLEGVTCEMRLNLTIMAQAGIRVDQLIAIGGGARSRKWLQLKADVLHMPITTVAVTEAACLGVAMLACAADTGEDVRTIATAWVRPQETIEPDPTVADEYDAKFEKYIQLYPLLKQLI